MKEKRLQPLFVMLLCSIMVGSVKEKCLHTTEERLWYKLRRIEHSLYHERGVKQQTRNLYGFMVIPTRYFTCHFLK